MKSRAPYSRRDWTPEEDQALREGYDGTGQSKKVLVNRLGRTLASIDNRIKKLGLCRKSMPGRSPWQSREDDIIEELTGDHSLEQILLAVNRWRKSQGLRDRSINSLRRYLERTGRSRQIFSADKFALNEIARGLCCSPSVVSGWVKQYKLKYEDLSDGKYVHRRTLKRFWTENPGVLQGLHPDMVWLVEILTAPDYDRELKPSKTEMPEIYGIPKKYGYG